MHRALSPLIGAPERDGTIFPTATVTLTTARHIRGTTTSAGSAFTITFPPSQDVVGEFFFVYMVARNGSKDITLAAVDRGSDVVLNAADEHVLIYSTGVEYIVPYAIGPTIS